MRTSLLCVLAFLSAGSAADSPTAFIVSAASPNIGIAPDSLATIFGKDLATQTASANSMPWPTSLGDMPVVNITDSNQKTVMALLLYVSPTQMNIYIPPGIAPGPAMVSFPVTGLPPGQGTAALRELPVTVQKVAPALFSADDSGQGPAAASAVRVVIPTQRQNPIAVVRCDQPGQCTAVPIDVGVDAPVYLSFYGTGIRGASSLDKVVVTIGTTQIKPTYAGPQPDVPGLDQVNVPLPISLRGAGLVNVTVTVDGVASNAVQIAIQ